MGGEGSPQFRGIDPVSQTGGGAPRSRAAGYSIKRKAWIRYEREHSLTAVHLDWHTSKINGKELCVVLDDSSRCILAGNEFDEATAENSINLVQEVLDRFGEIRKIE
jgi:hypothetical protein